MNSILFYLDVDKICIMYFIYIDQTTDCPTVKKN